MGGKSTFPPQKNALQDSWLMMLSTYNWNKFLHYQLSETRKRTGYHYFCTLESYAMFNLKCSFKRLINGNFGTCSFFFHSDKEMWRNFYWHSSIPPQMNLPCQHQKGLGTLNGETWQQDWSIVNASSPQSDECNNDHFINYTVSLTNRYGKMQKITTSLHRKAQEERLESFLIFNFLFIYGSPIVPC